MSTGAQQKAKYWPTAKAYAVAVLDGPTTEADRREREAITEGLDQLRHGWTPAEVVCVLMDAALTIQDARVWCDFCDEEITGDAVVDPVTVSWIGEGAPKFCCVWCLEARELRAINAAGNEAS